MSFLYPAFLIGAIAIAIPIALHLLRRNAAPEVPFTAVRLLHRSPLEQTRRRRLRDLLLLAARVAALLLLAAAFARPYYGASAESDLSIVAIDRSYSMAAPGRFERALTEARQAVAGARDRVAVIAFDDRATVVAPPGGRGEALAALDTVRPGFGATRFAAMFAKAAEVSGSGPARLIVISDLQRAGWEGEAPVTLPDGLRVEVRDTGPDAGNAAVMSVRRSGAGVLAGIANSGTAPRSGMARVSLDGRAVAAVPFSAPPGAAIDITIPYRAPDRGVLDVDIDDPAGYPADNRRFLILDDSSRARVLIVGMTDNGAGFYVSRALQSVDGDQAFDVQTSRPAALGSIPAAELARQSSVVLLTTRSLDRRGREMLSGFVRGGGGLLVAASPDVDSAVLATMMGWSRFTAVEETTAATILAPTDLRHPIFRPFGALAANLGQVRFSGLWRVRADGWDVAARFADGSPALLEQRQGSGHVLLFASDLDQRWNDFPLHAAFVPFAIEAVRHVTAFADRRRDYAVGDAPPDAPAEPGAHTLADGRRITINVDPREGATLRLGADEFMARVEAVPSQPHTPAARQAQQAEGQQSLWRYGLLLMLAALIVESAVGRIL